MAKFDDELAKRLRTINAQITTVERIYGRDSHIYKRILSTISKAGGKGTRFTKKMFTGSLRDTAKATNALSAVENSQYLTKEGRRRIGEKARDTFFKNRSSEGYDEATITLMYDIFKNSKNFSKFKEINVSSSAFIDAIMEAFETFDLKSDDMVKIIDNTLKEHAENINGVTVQERSQQAIDALWDVILNSNLGEGSADDTV